MLGTLYLAWKYIAFHRWATLWLVLSITLAIYLPISSRMLMQRFRSEIETRAATTPYIVGAAGSRFELAIHALHFTGTPPSVLEFGEVEGLADDVDTLMIPIHARYRTRRFDSQPDGYPIVGTSLDYFSFRRIEPSDGRLFGRIGDCVIGSELARREGLSCGDTLLSQAGNAYDLVADQPLKMRVVGILEPSFSDDDLAAFVDLKTAWVIEGLGHGHADLRTVDDDRILGHDGDTIVASDAVDQYIEITDDNVATFHFHGDPDTFPVTAAIALPADERENLVFEGQFLESDVTAMVIRPPVVMAELTERVFRAQRFFDGVVAVLLFVTCLFVTLLTLLSRKLRRREMDTMVKIGCAKWTMFRLQATELLIVFASSVGIAGGLAILTSLTAGQLVRQLVF